MKRVLGAALVGISMLAAPASAHDRSVSYSRWQIDGRDVRVVVQIADLELTRFPWARDGSASDRLADELPDQIRLSAGGGLCDVAALPRHLASDPGTTVIEWGLRCSSSDGFEIQDDWLFELAPRHLHFATVTRGGAEPVERVLTEADRVWQLGPAAVAKTASDVGSSFGAYLRLGIEHIASGYDHLAFLLALLLVAATLGEVAGVVTGFTVAHSITLAAAALGLVRPDRGAIEALIGLSIALVAAENLWLADRRATAPPRLIVGALVLVAIAAAAGIGRVPALTLVGLALFAASYFGLASRARAPQRLRWGVAFLFGLLHGFGFASALADAHLPSGRLLHALLGFNVGVEIGQLAVVAAIWPLLRMAGAERRERFGELGSAFVLALGVFWFVTRAYG